MERDIVCLSAVQVAKLGKTSALEVKLLSLLIPEKNQESRKPHFPGQADAVTSQKRVCHGRAESYHPLVICPSI